MLGDMAGIAIRPDLILANVLLSSLCAVALFVSPAVAQEDLCDWHSKTALEGNQGNSDSDDYWFKHISDVDQNDGKQRFRWCIGNKHPRNYLPVQWLRSDGTIQLAFQQIAPKKCGYSDFETNSSDKKDPGRIDFGPQKQFSKDAALNVVDRSNNRVSNNVGPLLKSRIIGDFQIEGGATENINLEFATATEGNQFAYTVTNAGSEPALFRIPALSQTWQKLAKIQAGIHIESSWTSEGDLFSAQADREAKRYIVRVEKNLVFNETQVTVEVISPNRRSAIAIAQITAYLPLLEQK